MNMVDGDGDGSGDGGHGDGDGHGHGRGHGYDDGVYKPACMTLPRKSAAFAPTGR